MEWSPVLAAPKTGMLKRNNIPTNQSFKPGSFLTTLCFHVWGQGTIFCFHVYKRELHKKEKEKRKEKNKMTGPMNSEAEQ